MKKNIYINEAFLHLEHNLNEIIYVRHFIQILPNLF